MAPKVSVVIPTYNQPAFLLEAIGSVLSQTFADYEIIVVNDGSTDDTLARLAPLCAVHADKLRVITQSNAGVGAARNRGIDESRGQYIAFLDHDDWWLPDKLMVQSAFLDSHPQCLGAVVPHAHSVDVARPSFDLGIVNGDGIVDRPLLRLSEGNVLITTSSALMVDRARCAPFRYGTLRNAIEDIPFQIQLMTHAPFGVAGDRVLAVWRVHAGNFSRQASYYYHGIHLLRQMQEQHAFGPLSAQQRRDLQKYLSHLGRVAAVSQLPDFRVRALALYLSEFPHQLSCARWKFLAALPAMLAMPRFVLARPNHGA